MITTNFILKNRQILLENENKLIGIVGQDKFHFDFQDEEWVNLHKTLKIIRPDEQIVFLPLYNDEVVLTQECYVYGVAKIGLFGTLNEDDPENMEIASTDYIALYFSPQAYGGIAINVPTPSEWDIIMGQLGEIVDDIRDLKTAIDSTVLAFNDYVEENITIIDTKVLNFVNDYNTKLEALNNIINSFNSDYATKKEIIDNEIAQFNSDYLQKVTDFNSNVTTKINEYNSNHTAKMKAYNDNHEEKMSDYDTNATQKISDFNDNASAKNTAFNSNYDDKLSAINTAGNTLIDSINTAGENALNQVIQYYGITCTQSEYDELTPVPTTSYIIEEAI